MENQKQKALIVKEFKKPPIYTETDIPQPGPNQVQIKLIASTINPVDKMIIEGVWRTEPNFIAGLQGVGKVIKAGSVEGEKFIGRRVSFSSENGTWAEYTIANLESIWEVDADVPIESAASGVVNPLTAIGFVDTYKKLSQKGVIGKGLVNSAAASALGRMLNKYCQKEKIPLLNIVRRKQQVKILQQQGAKHIINTSDEKWVQQYQDAVKKYGFNVLFDAIGGGDISDKLISNLSSGGQSFIYGTLSKDPLIISKPLLFTGGAVVTSWMFSGWLSTLSKEEVDVIRKNLPVLLKNQLSTHSIKKLKLSEVPQELKNSKNQAVEGKATILF